jgi:UDP-glucuronate decarboxylase
MNIKVMRIFNTYGPRMQPDDGRVISSFIMQALRGEPLTIFGDGSQTRSFCYVDDLVEAALRLMRTDSSVTGPINVGNPTEIKVIEAAKLVLRLTNSKSTIEFRPLPQDDPRQRKPEIDKARAHLGWEPTIGLEDGLIKTIRYFQTVVDSSR